MPQNDKSNNSFSSFADLSNLRMQLRQQEADDAQRKADAIEVDKDKEHLNPLKQKAAALSHWASSQKPQIKDDGSFAQAFAQTKPRHTTKSSPEKSVDKTNFAEALASASSQAVPQRGQSVVERGAGHSRSSGSSGAGADSRKSGKGAKPSREQSSSTTAPRSRAEQENDAQRLEQALNRLQRKVDADNAERNKSSKGQPQGGAQTQERGQHSAKKHRGQPNQGQGKQALQGSAHFTQTEDGTADRAQGQQGQGQSEDRAERQQRHLHQRGERHRTASDAEVSSDQEVADLSTTAPAQKSGQRHQRPAEGKSGKNKRSEPNQKQQAQSKKSEDRNQRNSQKGPKLKNHELIKLLRENGIKQDHFYDAEMLKQVKAAADQVAYQSRRQLFNKLYDLDQLILSTLRQIVLQDREAAAAAAKASAHVGANAGATVEASGAGAVEVAQSESVQRSEAVESAAAAADVSSGTGETASQLSLWQRIMADPKVQKFKQDLALEITKAKEWLSLHQESLPKLEYPESLPVSQRKDEIIKAIQTHQVVIIAGETGSGKTTQIPKMCLEAGYGRKGMIGHTQPRRIAARAVAARIASEMHEELGKSVSYKVRFTDISSPDSYIKLMTDGILLSELSSDRLLLGYEVVIIDEAHERSLNIDFLLGYLKGLLKKRPELKLIITSATIDVERFSEHFDNAPIIEVSGRTYPVEVVYMPLMDDGKGVYIEGHDGQGRYEKDPKSLNHLVQGRDDPELVEGPGAWQGYQAGSKAGMLSDIPRYSVGEISLATNPHPKKLKKAKSKAPTQTIDDDDRDVADTLDLRQGILQAVNYLEKRGRGDILVFLPGERDILEISQFLKKSELRDIEIVPLYARLATHEQNKIFTEHTGMRIVLATNVAETSLTVPGIKYVIDPGLARISRYSSRTKVQRLPIEPISQASANQRKGRCGRVSDGVCVRLYSKEDFESRPEFTDPEILRTNLASVLLQMASLRLGHIENFPFIDAPQPRQVSDGLRLLQELGAVQDEKSRKAEAAAQQGSPAEKGDGERSGRDSRDNREGEFLRLTSIGHALARLPCDPRLGRMIVEADKHHALTEVLVIVSALAVMDPREYPLDKKEAASTAHKRFADEKSDFLSYIKLHEYIKGLQSSLSGSALRRQLKQEFISFLRVREWLDVLRQLRASAHAMDLKFNEEPATYDEIHRSLVSGLLSHLGMLEPNGNNYIGARGARFVIFPGSSLAKKPPKWICACELAETSRLFARTVAAIDPGYAEEVGEHLIKNTYNEPHWSKKSGAVVAYQTRSIYGLPIVQKRLVQYQHVDPRLCHELFIREGLVGGNIDRPLPFLQHNLELINDVEYLEDKVRRRDLLVDANTIEQFYQERIPETICNIRDFEYWWKQQSKLNPDFLDFSYELIAKQDMDSIEEQLYPEFWQQGNLRLKLSYIFDIGSERDGVTVHVPVTVLNQVHAEEFLWQIDGLRPELLASLIRSLPKRLRRNLIPAPEYAKALNESLSVYTKLINPRDNPQDHASSLPPAPGKKHQAAAQAQAKSEFLNKARQKVDNLFVVVARELTRMGGELVTIEDFDRTAIEPYLFMNFAIEGVNGQELAFGKDFKLLAEKLQTTARDALHQVVKTHQIKPPAQSWQYGTIKRQQVSTQGTLKITAYPALTDRGNGVTLELYDSPERQAKAMRQGAIKLLALSLKSPTSYLETHLPNRSKLAMYYQPLGTIQELIFDLMMCAIGNIMERNGGIPWDEAHFDKLKEVVRGELNDEALAVAKLVEQSLVKAHELKRLLKGNISFELARTYSDLSRQLEHLVYKGFISESGMEHLTELPRYLQAALERVSRAQRDVVRDQIYMRTLENLEDEYEKVMRSYHEELMPAPLKDVKWMIQELRVSYFAQHLGVNGPISDKRIYVELERIQKEWPPHK